MDIKITRLDLVGRSTPNSEVIADFDAEIGDFLVTNGTLRRNCDGGYFVLAGRSYGRRGSIRLSANCPTRDALQAAVLEAYHGG